MLAATCSPTGVKLNAGSPARPLRSPCVVGAVLATLQVPDHTCWLMPKGKFNRSDRTRDCVVHPLVIKNKHHGLHKILFVVAPAHR
ncbi:hypothetical protein FHG87_003862 [Trinorchestia longiramus]|nr:hypothetical protein FHG87_003862 [Trinorchestia longiramus]